LTIKESFRLDHTSIRLLFDSILITLEIYHDSKSGLGATEVRRVDRFDYELIDVLNWDKDDNYDKKANLPIVQMIGVSKVL
jgi:hypothetical protein